MFRTLFHVCIIIVGVFGVSMYSEIKLQRTAMQGDHARIILYIIAFGGYISFRVAEVYELLKEKLE